MVRVVADTFEKKTQKTSAADLRIGRLGEARPQIAEAADERAATGRQLGERLATADRGEQRPVGVGVHRFDGFGAVLGGEIGGTEARPFRQLPFLR